MAEILITGGGGRFGMAESACRTINYDATQNLLDVCRDSAELKRFVHASTVAVMGKRD